MSYRSLRSQFLNPDGLSHPLRMWRWFGVILLSALILPCTAMGNPRYAAPVYGWEEPSGKLSAMEGQLQESSQGQVYRVQYVPPVTTNPGGQGAAQMGGPGPAEQPRQSMATLVPFITVSERYDSNVLSSTNKVHDYITNVSPGARWNFLNSYFDGSLMETMIAERYARNPGLSYIGTTGALNLGLDNTVGRLIRGWSLRVSDSFMYTPQQPAFVAPEAGNQVPSSFVRGIQAYRANSLSNVGAITSTMPLASNTTFVTTYTHQILRFFGKSDPSLTGALFNVTNQTLSAGPQYRLSPNHSVGVTYQFQDMAFDSQGGSTTPGGITTHGGMLTWQGTLTRLITVDVAVGGAVILPANSIQTTARAALQYTTPVITSSLSYSRGISPSYYLAGGALISDLVGLTVMYNASPSWYVLGSYNYQTSHLTDGPSLRFESHGPVGSINYRITPTIVATGQVSYYQLSFGSAGAQTVFNRELFTLSIRAEWN